MDQRTFSVPVIVLKKNQLGESDLILTFLAQDGSQLRAVAKGARKPTSPFASRLELFSCADVLFAKGRNLDIVKEARLIQGYGPLRNDYDLCIAAAPIAELLVRITDRDLESPRLFPLTHAALTTLSSGECKHAALVCAGFILKALSFSGFRPSFDACASCGQSVESKRSLNASFSYDEGGVLCDRCAEDIEAVYVPMQVVEWARALLFARFSEILQMDCDGKTEFQLLQFCQQWTRYHAGANMKSLSFYLVNADF